jgi:hypothetical protein
MDDILVWSRMGVEAGDELNVTIDRKERERIAGAGEFFLGRRQFLTSRQRSSSRAADRHYFFDRQEQ